VSGPSTGAPVAGDRVRRGILVLSGPNLGLLGERQPDVYGSATLAEHLERAEATADALGFEVTHRQSDDEAALIGEVHAARGEMAAIVVNAGALTHSSWSLCDALAAFDGVVVELHLSNPAAREPWRHTSVVAQATDGMVAGFGGLGYELAIRAVAGLVAGSGTDDGRSGRAPQCVRQEEMRP